MTSLIDPTATALIARLEESPGDFTGYLVLADRLQELGDPPEFELALRWAAGRRQHPVKHPKVKQRPWLWWRASGPWWSINASAAEVDRFRPARLEHTVWVAMFEVAGHARKGYVGYPSWESAVVQLGRGLGRLARLVSPEPDGIDGT